MLKLTAVLLLPLAGCQAHDQRMEQAKQLIASRCAACHRVPGVRDATGRVGPSLDGIARQQLLAGFFENNRVNMVRWISHPQAMLPGNGMQDPGLSPAQAEIVADYLYTLD